MQANKRKTKVSRSQIFGCLLLAVAVGFSILLGLFVEDRLPVAYEDTVLTYAEAYDVPPALIFSVIQTESHFDKDAVSSAGAKGLMQMTPETFSWLQTKTGESLPENALFEPSVSIRYGTFFLSLLLEEFPVRDTAIAAYNAGLNAVARWLENPEYSDDGAHLKNIPYSETAYYVVKVNRSLESYSELYDSE